MRPAKMSLWSVAISVAVAGGCIVNAQTVAGSGKSFAVKMAIDGDDAVPVAAVREAGALPDAVGAVTMHRPELPELPFWCDISALHLEDATGDIADLLGDDDPANPPPDEGEAYDPTEPNCFRRARSVGGRRIRISDMPWQAQLYQPWTTAQFAAARSPQTEDRRTLWEMQHLCGATLIRPDWALTAAHCISEGDSQTGYRLRLGANSITTGDQRGNSRWTYRIDRVVVFDRTATADNGGVWRSHDIALVHFIDDRRIGRPPPELASPILLANTPQLRDGAAVTTGGWGRFNNGNNGRRSSALIRLDLNIVDNSRCARGPWGARSQDARWGPRIHPRILCAAAPGRQTCQGDSGGPLVTRDLAGTIRLVGVVSWNNAACVGDERLQGVYTRVSSYLIWINQIAPLPRARRLTSGVQARHPEPDCSEESRPCDD